MSTTPPSLFKYEPPTLQTLLNLKRQTLFFGSPRRFNDPYDCGLVPRVRPPTAEQMMEFKARYVVDPSKPDEARRELLAMPDSAVSSLIVSSGTKALHQATEDFLSKKGVTCFSETNDNLLMWSHYAQRGSGLCLEFDTRHEPFHKVMPVQYSETMPEIDVTSLLLNSDHSEITRLYCTKSIHWSYEREWRGIHNEADTSFTYPPECLRAVYFGAEVDFAFFEIVCLILKGQNDRVRLFFGKRSNIHFKLDFTELTYQTHLEARSRGQDAN